jgi:hypothetical protein
VPDIHYRPLTAQRFPQALFFGLRMVKNELERSNFEPISVPEASRLRDPTIIQVSSVAAAKIYQPELGFMLDLDLRMPPRHHLAG